MDNLGISWGPRPVLLGIAAAGAVVAVVAAVVLANGGDRPGALLLGILAVLAAAATAHGVLVRPRLSADSDGVVVRTATRTHRLRWSQLETEVRSTRRLARDVRTLELEFPDDDGDRVLVVLGWLELGADPDDVLDDLNRVRAS